MKRAFHGANILLGLFLFAALGFAIFCGGAYLYAHGLELELPSMQLRVKIDWKTPLIIEKYTGPQNAQELMKALDADYNKGHAKTEVSLSRKVTGIETESYSSSLTMREIDARYPRAEWLQLLLERGIIIENLLEYVSNLSQRHALAFLEDNPNLRQSGILDIPPTDDWEIYKAAYIHKLVEIERTKVETELVKAEIERRKPEIERTIERIKEQIERAKVRIEHSKKDVERAKKELNSQQFENVRKQLEHARKQLERAQEALEHLKEPTPPQELTPPEKPK